MGATTQVAKVIANWDNRENTNNYQHHKPHHLIVFEGDSKESPNRAKINYGNNPDRNACSLAMAQVIERGRSYVFTLETGEKDGHPWKAIREVRDITGTLLGTSEPPEDGEDVVPEATPEPPPAAKPAPKPAAPPVQVPPAAPAAAVPAPGPAKPTNGTSKPPATDTLVHRMLIEKTAEFWAEKDRQENLRITRGAGFNCAALFISRAADHFVQFTETDGLRVDTVSLAPAVGTLADMFTALLRTKHEQDLVDRHRALLALCVSVADVDELMLHVRGLLGEAAYATLKPDGVTRRTEIKNGGKPAGGY
jgi:hypothetical protein